MHVGLVDVKLPEDDLKQVETCWSVSGFYFARKCTSNTSAFVSITALKTSAAVGRLVQSACQVERQVTNSV